MTMKTSYYLLTALAALGMISCNKIDSPSPEQAEMGTIRVSVVEDPTQTKAVTAYTTSQDYEKAVKNVQVFIFDEAGNINIYSDLGTNVSASIATTAGKKTIWAVVNGKNLSSVKTLTDLKAETVKLEDNSKTGGFVMAGSGTCTVGTSEVTCSVSVSRLVSRIALRSVTNNLPSSLGSLEIRNVFISNVVGNQNIGGSAAASTWYNKEGRADESSRDKTHIINGSTYKASCPDLTYNGTVTEVSNGSAYTPSTPYLFYGFPNSSTTKPDGFSTTFAAQRTVLVVTAAVDGKVQYYPVFLDNALLERNKTYTVGLTITGLGSDDPNKEVQKGSVKVSISVANWTSGATYDETI